MALAPLLAAHAVRLNPEHASLSLPLKVPPPESSCDRHTRGRSRPAG